MHLYNFCKHKTLFVKNISVAYPITKQDSALPIIDEILLQSDLIPSSFKSLLRATRIPTMDDEFSKYVFKSENAVAFSSSTGPTCGS